MHIKQTMLGHLNVITESIVLGRCVASVTLNDHPKVGEDRSVLPSSHVCPTSWA